MGRLSALRRAWPRAAVVAALAAAGCKTETAEPTTTGSSRSDAVKASGPVASAVAPAPSHAAPSAPRTLCQGKPAGAGRGLPDQKLDRVEAAGATPLESRIETGGGRWTWVNFWAGWCEPCKEEIPRLRSFAAQEKTVRVAFVSLDDDERQSRRFLDAQPAGGFRASYWLKDDKAREAFLQPLRIDTVPTLPFHLLFDPDGKLRCRIDGAIDDQDLPALRTLFSAR